jgi:hypothetical protein
MCLQLMQWTQHDDLVRSQVAVDWFQLQRCCPHWQIRLQYLHSKMAIAQTAQTVAAVQKT